jgi:TolA-binding protein
MRLSMIGRIVLALGVLAGVLAGFLAPRVLISAGRAQDVPGIEICTVEKTMERRTSCLQSNVDFLQKTIARLAADHAQKLDAANRQIEGLKATVASLQKIADELQAAQRKTAEDLKKAAAPPARDGAAAKEGGK